MANLNRTVAEVNVLLDKLDALYSRNELYSKEELYNKNELYSKEELDTVFDDIYKKLKNSGASPKFASISANTLSGVAENGEFTPINEYFEE